MRTMDPSRIRAICFDLDNTLWDVEPVLARAERILTDWLEARYPKIPQRFSAREMQQVRAQLLADALTMEPAEILFVGDDPHADVVGPRDAGMQTVWANRARLAWPAALPAADASVARLDELVALLIA